MKLQELVNIPNLIIRIVWGERVIEFPSEVVDRDTGGIYVIPYIHGGEPLNLDIGMRSGVVCHVFGDSPEDGTRISWRNVCLNTVTYKERVLYYLTTFSFNSESQADDRRGDSRIKISKPASIIDTTTRKSVPIRINDVSDQGIAFYAPTGYQPSSNIITIFFEDDVNGHHFAMNIKCRIVRTKKMPGTVFYGCSISENNNDFLIYGCVRRLNKSQPTE